MGWRRLAVPGICERMIGFSVPEDDSVLVVSYEGIHLVWLAEPVTVETDSEYREYDLYDPNTGVCRYRGREWNIIGLCPGRPVLTGLDPGAIQNDEVGNGNAGRGFRDPRGLINVSDQRVRPWLPPFGLPAPPYARLTHHDSSLHFLLFEAERGKLASRKGTVLPSCWYKVRNAGWSS